MSFASVLKVEFVKLVTKRISLLLFLFLIPSTLFGIGMACGLSFFVSDGGGGGVNAVETSLSGMGFAVNMMEQSKYIIFLVIIILAASILSGELENGQIKSEIIRICSRSKIVVAKYIVLLGAVYSVTILSLFWALLVYVILVKNTPFASGLIFDELIEAHLGYILFTMLGMATTISITFLFGVKLKTFPCFAISYILWFTSLYTDFMEKIKLVIPYNMPVFLLENAGMVSQTIPYAGLYMGYCLIFVILSCVGLKKMDIKA